MKVQTLACLAIGWATHALAQSPSRVLPRQAVSSPSTFPVPGQLTSQGCYASEGNLTTMDGDHSLVSSGYCNKLCAAKQYWVMGVRGGECLCGYAYPPKKDAAKDSDCDYPCPSYPQEACGGLGSPTHFNIYNMGINIDVENYSPPKSSSSASSSSTSAATSTASSSATSDAGSVVPTTSAPEATAAPTETGDKHSGSSTNTAAIGAGVGVGVAAVIAGVVGVFFFLRRRRNADIEEEHRRNAAVNAFISGSKPPSSNGSISMSDSRLDPIMAHRRLSDGSIADNEDYSRKILRVTNA